MRQVSPVTTENNASNKETEKEKALKLIELKLKRLEEKKEQEATNTEVIQKKKSHFWSDLKVLASLSPKIQ